MAYTFGGGRDRLLPGHIHRVAGADTDWDALAAKVAAKTTAASLSTKEPPANSDDVREVESASEGPSGHAKAPSRPRTRPPTPRVSLTERVQSLRKADTLDMESLKKVAWAGLPHEVRADTWRMLLDYMPSSSVRRSEAVARKRQMYRDAVAQHYATEPADSGDREDATMRQISVDIPRTSPGLALFRIPEVQAALQRVLYVWASRHPASGYVQGMNDLVTPFFFVFLSEFMKEGDEMDMLSWTSLDGLGDASAAIAVAEADSYWCLTALLNDIQDYYTFAQPGIQRRVLYLRDLVGRVDAPLKSHLETEGVDFIQFAFRWMNCLLMREMPFPLIVRVWDTYLAEPDGFALFHVYVCAALLVWFSDQLQEMDFQDMVMFLQNLPTEDWTTKEIDVVLSQAYMWRTIFGAAPSHLQQT